MHLGQNERGDIIDKLSGNLNMITFIKELNKTQIAGIIIAIIASVYALINENDTLDTIAGGITAIGVSLLILGKSHLKK